MPRRPVALVVMLVASLCCASIAFAKEVVDLVTVDPPAGWAKEVKPRTYTSWTSTNKKKGTYCQLFVMLSVDSRGSIERDFETEWKNLVVTQYGTTAAPKVTAPRVEGGWQIKNGQAPFTFNGAAATATLTTMTGSGKTMSIVSVTNSEDYRGAIDAFLGSVVTAKGSAAPPAVAVAAVTSSKGTTNFDDGWTSTVQEDWVQVTRGATRVLIHYPNKKADAYNSVLLDGLQNAWNVLVVPRYAAIRNLEMKPVSSWESIEFAEADATEKTTGKTVHVVLFKRNYSNGRGRYLEFLTPDKGAFEKEFGPYHESSYGWEKLEQMASYDKFIVSAAALQGKWTSDFSGAIAYVNANTGLDAGTDTHASVENFQIASGGTYTWDLGVASGPVGNIKFQSAKSSGKVSVLPGGWKVTFSDIEGKPRTYDARFSQIKGLQILWLDDRPFAKAQ